MTINRGCTVYLFSKAEHSQKTRKHKKIDFSQSSVHVLLQKKEHVSLKKCLANPKVMFIACTIGYI